MKYWNKSKKARELNWTRVETFKSALDKNGVWFAPSGIMRANKYFSFSVEAKRWCQQQPGGGRFYVRPYTSEWYFEFSEDALAFKLKWAIK
jgi:hypothetical protein